MKATGNTPPMLGCEAKAKYMPMALLRDAKYFGLPLKFPSAFPTMTLKAQRLLTAVEMQNDAVMLENLTRALWQAYWCNDQDISQESVLLDICSSVALKNAATLLETSASAPVKSRLQAATDLAVSRGAFGAPTIFISDPLLPDSTPSMYFGSDRFHLIIPELGLPWVGPFPSTPAAKL